MKLNIRKHKGKHKEKENKLALANKPAALPALWYRWRTRKFLRQRYGSPTEHTGATLSRFLTCYARAHARSGRAESSPSPATGHRPPPPAPVPRHRRSSPAPRTPPLSSPLRLPRLFPAARAPPLPRRLRPPPACWHNAAAACLLAPRLACLLCLPYPSSPSPPPPLPRHPELPPATCSTQVLQEKGKFFGGVCGVCVVCVCGVCVCGVCVVW